MSPWVCRSLMALMPTSHLADAFKELKSSASPFHASHALKPLFPNQVTWCTQNHAAASSPVSEQVSAGGTMRALGETSAEEITPPSCRLSLNVPRAQGRSHTALGPAQCGISSWAATSREWDRYAPWAPLIATTGSPSFALAPAPCPGKPPAEGNRVPMGRLRKSPIAI